MNEGMWEAQKQKAKTLGQNIMIVWGGTTSKGGQGARAARCWGRWTGLASSSESPGDAMLRLV